MKGALGKKELLAVVPLSWSTIDRMERAVWSAQGNFLNAGISLTNAAHGTVMKLSVGLMNVRQQARQSSRVKNLLFSNVYIVL